MKVRIDGMISEMTQVPDCIGCSGVAARLREKEVSTCRLADVHLLDSHIQCRDVSKGDEKEEEEEERKKGGK